MRAIGSNKVLGLAVGERGVTACELSRAGGAARATAMAEFVYPAGVSAEDPAALGAALKAFLRDHRLGARRAVVGLPLRWAVIKPKEVPPASADALAGMLRLQAERDFAMELQDLALEYAGEASPSAPGTVLLVAVPRKRLDFVTKLTEAAGISVEAITLTAVALAEATGKAGGGEGAVLHVGAGAAELAVQHRGHPRVLRHLRVPAGVGAAGAGAGGASTATPEAATPPTAPAAALTLELRQVLSLMPQNGTAGELMVWDGVGLGDAAAEWSDAFGVSVREQSLDSLGVTAAAANGTGPGGAGAAGGGRFAPAVALGLVGLLGSPATPDLLHSRLAEPKASRVSRPLVWGVVAGCAVVLGIVLAVVDLSTERGKLDDVKTRLGQVQPELKTADATITRVSFAQRWYEQDPKFLKCVRDLTAAFPDDPQVWATRLSLQEDGRGSLEGQATRIEVANAALRRLQDDGHFKDVKVLTIGEAGRNAKEVTFSVTFRFLDPAATTAGPTSGPASSRPATNSYATGPTTGAAVNTDDAPAFDRRRGDSGRRRNRNYNDSRRQ